MWKPFACTIHFLLILVYQVGALKSCYCEGNGTCTTKITLNLSIGSRVPFRLFYRHANNTRDAAPSLDCDWNKAILTCSKDVGYNFTQPSDEVLYVYIDPSKKCIQNGTFEFEVKRSGKVVCNFNINITSKSGLPQCRLASNASAESECHSTPSPQVNNITAAEENGDNITRSSSPKGSPENTKDENTAIPVAIGLCLGIFIIASVVAIAIWKRDRLRNLWPCMNLGADNHIRSQDNATAQTLQISRLPGEAEEKKIEEGEDQETPMMVGNEA